MSNNRYPDKPPYQVPSMAKIAQVRGTNGLRVVSTFSGAGGSCLGFEMAGYEILYASEFVEAAREVYKLNHPGVHVDPRDIRKVTIEDIRKVVGPGEIDVLEGSPPCASFSTAGKREKSWGDVKSYSDTKQRTDDLFFEFARILRGLKPRTFVAENVKGLVTGKAKGYFKEILRELKSCGYRVVCRVLDAQWLGVPQRRQRTIFVGVREDLEFDPVHPSPLPYFYSVRDAIGDVEFEQESTSPMVRNHFQDADDGSSAVMAHGVNGGREYQTRIPNTGLIPESVMAVQGYQAGQVGVDRYSHKSLENPSPTICGSDGGKPLTHINPVIAEPHPASLEGHANGKKYQYRKFYISELKRICGFPDDFQLVGRYEKQWERLGRAVPPVMMFHVAKRLAQELIK